MTKEDKEHYTAINIFRFCEKGILSDKVKYHCHLTGEVRGPAHHKCNINVKQEQIKFVAFVFHKFNNYDYHLFFKKIVERRKI